MNKRIQILCKVFSMMMTAVMAMSVLASCAASGIKVNDLRCEYISEPMTIDNTQPHFSWKMLAKAKIAANKSFFIYVWFRFFDFYALDYANL